MTRYFCPESHQIPNDKVPFCPDCNLRYSSADILTSVYVDLISDRESRPTNLSKSMGSGDAPASKRLRLLEAVADAADTLLLNAYGTEECFNPPTYEVASEYMMKLQIAVSELEDAESE